MKKLNVLMTIMLLIFVTTGCTGRIVHMKNDQGSEITCEVSTMSAMMTGVLIRDSSIEDCVKQKKAAGFKVTHEEK